MDHLRSVVQDQHGQHGETPSLLKIQKLKKKNILKRIKLKHNLPRFVEAANAEGNV